MQMVLILFCKICMFSLRDLHRWRLGNPAQSPSEWLCMQCLSHAYVCACEWEHTQALSQNIHHTVYCFGIAIQFTLTELGSYTLDAHANCPSFSQVLDPPSPPNASQDITPNTNVREIGVATIIFSHLQRGWQMLLITCQWTSVYTFLYICWRFGFYML